MIQEALTAIREIAICTDGPPVEQTVAARALERLASHAEIVTVPAAQLCSAPGRLVIAVASETHGPLLARRLQQPLPDHWFWLRLDVQGGGEILSSHPHLLFAAFCRLEEKADLERLPEGMLVVPTFRWLRNLSDFVVGSLRIARGFNREQFMEQLARIGFSHVSINGLGVEGPYESGPPGDVYSWFYDYSPDLDQFVSSTLVQGYYPDEYLKANLEYLKSNAALALKYGLTPGLHINSPRSMPEEFWTRFPFLRGARIDHPRESFRPRYTLALAHPAVQEHYRQLVRKIMGEVPQIGFMHLWTNDSGAGFEFTCSLYAGRNGGPYLIREWKSHDEIARAAGANVLTYYHLLRDEARRVNPEFRLICDLGPFDVERPYIIPGLGDGIDAGRFAYFEFQDREEELRHLGEVGALLHVFLDLTMNNVLGAPFPWLVHERLQEAQQANARWVLGHVCPASLAPYDINGEVIRRFQVEPELGLEALLRQFAARWVGERHAETLIAVWGLADDAVRGFPAGMPYATFAFPWFRLWVRPFVPNIDAIPEHERAYYEKFLIATFNNPNRVDLNNDMLWNFLSVEEARAKKETIDERTLAPLARAIEKANHVLESLTDDTAAHAVFLDQRVRLTALRCFFTTLRNTAAWIEAVHGYRAAENSGRETVYRMKLHETIAHELENSWMLLNLWRTSHVDFMPVSKTRETAHIYGDNFGDLLERRIALMERHIDDEPYIDPNYMWRVKSFEL